MFPYFRRPSTSSESSRRGSKADLQEIEEQSTQENESGGKDLPAISEVPSKKVKLYYEA